MFFADIDDTLTEELTSDYAEVFRSIRELMALLDVDSYAEMGDQHEHAAQLLKRETELSARIRHSLPEELPSNLDPTIIETFLTAYRLECLYPETVGSFAETASTIPLITLPHFHAREVDPEIRSRAFAELASRFQISAEALGRIDQAFAVAREKLSRRRTFVDYTRSRLLNENGEPRERDLLKAEFDHYFPRNHLHASEIELVVTRTCVYWCLPKPSELEPRETDEERESVVAWLKHTGRFAFQYFSHFTTISSFDARDAEPAWLAEIVDDLGWPESEVIQLLNSTTTLEKTSEIEKYLIHDTWGHMWQGDLTDLGRLYDTMESLKSPVDANEHLELPEGNVISPLDLIYLTAQGRIRFDDELAARYLDHWIRLRLEAALAPIVAELTADSIEYKFKLDNGERGEDLPSSSMFSNNPAKLDFAWVDISYFIRSLRRTHDGYFKNDALRLSLIERTALLLKLKYPR
ncbi:MAG: hypothetical protein AAF236_17150, partial [Verrucomicrobiota bacterium]